MGEFKLKFSKYDFNNFQLKISKDEIKQLYTEIDNLTKEAPSDLGYSDIFRTFFIGLKNLNN